MQADLQDVVFYYRLKSRLKITDSGLVDMLLGLSISMFHISIASEFTSCYSSQTLFSTHDKSLVFKVDLLNFSTCNTKHNFFNVLKEIY